MVKSFFRYDTGAKEFKEIPSNREFTIAVDAVALNESYFKNKEVKNLF